MSKYPRIAAALAGSTGIEPEWTKSGLLVLEPESVVSARVWARIAHEPFETLSREDITRRFPGVVAPESAIFLPDVAQIRNPRLLKALDAQLRLEGAELRFNEPAKSLLWEGKRTVGVETRGGPAHSQYTVVCAGAGCGSPGTAAAAPAAASFRTSRRVNSAIDASLAMRGG